MAALPLTLTISVPSEFAHIRSVDMRVARANGNAPLWVELTRQVFSFVADTMSAQAASGCMTRKHPREDNDPIECGVNGVSMSYKRNAIRVVYKENERLKTRYFDAATSGVDGALHRAVEFVGSLNEPRG